MEKKKHYHEELCIVCEPLIYLKSSIPKPFPKSFIDDIGQHRPSSRPADAIRKMMTWDGPQDETVQLVIEPFFVEGTAGQRYRSLITMESKAPQWP